PVRERPERERVRAHRGKVRQREGHRGRWKRAIRGREFPPGQKLAEWQRDRRRLGLLRTGCLPEKGQGQQQLQAVPRGSGITSRAISAQKRASERACAACSLVYSSVGMNSASP